MRLGLWICICGLLLTWESRAEQSTRWLVELTDKSKVFVEPLSSALVLKSEILEGNTLIAVDSIKTATKNEDGFWQVTLLNGDRLTGKLGHEPILGRSLVGKLKLEPRSVLRIEAMRGDSGMTPSTVSDVPRVKYQNLDWELWRTNWEARDGEKLTSLRSIRPGFAYGHWANGRGGMALTGNGDREWTDYEVAFNYKMLPANREFYHAHIPGETRGMMVYFRAKSLSESWNQPDTGYGIAINPSGTWTLIAYDGWHIPGKGWGSARKGTLEKLATGKLTDMGEKDISEGRIVLSIRGNRFRAWVNGAPLFDHTHDSGPVEPIPFGGFGVQWRYESMGWIENLVVKRAPVFAALPDGSRSR